MVDLTTEERLVLFECLHRMCETERIAVSHPAEAVVIDKMAAQLERELTEPFEPSCPATLAAARDSVLDQYQELMVEDGWVSRVSLEQS